MNKSGYSRVCITDTVYTLLLYLLYSSEEEIDTTFFFFGDGIHNSIRKNFDHYYFKKPKKIGFKYILGMFLFIRAVRFLRWPFLKFATIFGHDHLFYSPYIIVNREYKLIEDGPHSFKVQWSIKAQKDYTLFWKKKKIKRTILSRLFGPLYGHSIGDNIQCGELIITENEIMPYMERKKVTVISPHSLWECAPKTKKTLILKACNITQDDICLLKTKDNVLFTQQFADDGFIDWDEQYRIYKKIINNYDKNSLLIKTHPRETSNYKKECPDVLVFDKPIPIQLLDMLGIRFKKAITISSTSVMSFNYKLDIDWYGHEISDQLMKTKGHLDCPISDVNFIAVGNRVV
jgi:hypothetical protein